jgi:two-component system NtrC family sensor kinase
MGLMVFVRQTLLDRELLRLLNQSEESFANLKRLQAQITESEKLASIGQLVGGAAHELNNPIAAMLGYSDLLLNTPLNADQQALATRIGQHVRRTKSLVASLLSFAKQSPVALSSVNLATLLLTAVRLSQAQWKSLNIEISTRFQPDTPPIMGDSNQLLQVCMQILNSAIHTADQQNSRGLTITYEHREGVVTVDVFDAKSASYTTLSPLSFCENSSPETADPLSGLGLSACRGMLQQHHGTIVALHSKDKGFSIRVELPIIPPSPAGLPVPSVPIRWLSQPFA